MNELRAAALIEKISYRPGWKISAHVPLEGVPFVLVTATLTTPNSNRDNALKGYPETLTLSAPDLIIDAGRYETPEALYRRIFDWIMGLEIHEAREFFRVGDDMRAPFHPHRADGNDAWERTDDAVSVA